MKPQNQILEIWGDLACFSRPEMKVERFSYSVITPSAARGIFDAIFAKPPQFRWQVKRIEVLNHPKFLALRRNEVKEKVSVRAVKDWMAGKKHPTPIWADGDRDLLGSDEKGRTQRQTMALKDVRYRVHAEIRPWPGFERMQPDLESQFRRRASQGKCFQQPYFGCREFPAYFRLLDRQSLVEDPVDLNLDLGIMLYDVFDLSRPGSPLDSPSISFFEADLKSGVLMVPEYESSSVLRSAGRET